MKLELVSAVYIAEHQQDLLEAHWQEIARDKKLMKLSPDVSQYRAMEDADMLISIGAFDDDGKMCGYAVSFIGTHLHYSELTYAHNDVLFVAEEYRSKRLGLRLIRETERIAKEKGARMVSWHAKQDSMLAAMLPKLGYCVQDIIFSREV
jgi:predicted GNAT superfamily acetyltransferase